MKFQFPESVVDVNTVPEQFRGMYAEDTDGTFKIAEFAAGAREAILGLNTALEASRKEAKQAKASQIDLSVLSEYGDTPEAIAETFSAKLQEVAGDKVDVEKIKQSMQAGHQKELEAREQQVASYRGQLEQIMVNDASLSAIAKHKGDTDLLMPHVRNRLKTMEKEVDGKPVFQVVVLGDDGEPAYNNNGNPMSVDDLVGGMKSDKKYGRLFESEAQSGGGQRRNPTAPNAQQQANQNSMSSTAKISAGLNERGV